MRTLRSTWPAALVAVMLAGCGSEEPSAPAPTSAPTEAASAAPEPSTQTGGTATPAINSITVDPDDGTLMIGSGPALYRLAPGDSRPQELTGQLTTAQGEASVSGNLVVRFTGPGELLASGHPQEGELPENLPLIRSTDHGDSWEVVPNTAEGDYHELEVVGDLFIAVNAESPDILLSRDGGRSWESKTPPAPPIDVVVDPKDPQRWAVSTEEGTFGSNDGGGSWRPRDPSFGARLIWTDALYSIDRNGKVRVSEDGGASWSDRGEVGGLPSEVAAGSKDELLVAIVGGKVRRSRDGGKRWDTRTTLG
jgi:hypothetical protein